MTALVFIAGGVVGAGVTLLVVAAVSINKSDYL